MRLIIAGGRKLKISHILIDGLCTHYGFDKFTVTKVVCGMADGVDLAGKLWAKMLGITVKPFPVVKADWDKYGKAAGPIRNKKMADYADELLLIWDGKSKGSANMKKLMLQAGKPVHEIIIKDSLNA